MSKLQALRLTLLLQDTNLPLDALYETLLLPQVTFECALNVHVPSLCDLLNVEGHIVILCEVARVQKKVVPWCLPAHSSLVPTVEITSSLEGMPMQQLVLDLVALDRAMVARGVGVVEGNLPDILKVDSIRVGKPGIELFYLSL